MIGRDVPLGMCDTNSMDVGVTPPLLVPSTLRSCNYWALLPHVKLGGWGHITQNFPRSSIHTGGKSKTSEMMQ